MYTAIRSLNKFFKSGMYDYCNLETNDSEDMTDSSFVNKDGGMSTVIKINGSYKLIGAARFKELILGLIEDLSGTLRKPGYKIDFFYTNDPYSSKRKVDQSLDPVYKSLKRLNLNMEDIIKERAKVLSERTTYENCYMVLTTLPSVLTGKTLSQELKERLDRVKGLNIGIKPGEFGLSPHFAIDGLRDIHLGFTTTFEDALAASNTAFKRLDVHEALRCIKFEINAEVTSSQWKASLLGDKIKIRSTKEAGNDIDSSHTMNPNIAFQLFNQRPRVSDNDSSLIKMGGKVIAPILVDLPPQESKPFSELIEKLDKSIPWRFSFTMETGHKEVLSKVANKNSMATALSMFSSDNRLIRDAAEELMELAREGEPLVMGSMTFCTWADDERQANRRKQMIMQQASNWGAVELLEEFGDPISAWMDSVPCMSRRKISTPFPICMTDAFTILPVTHQTSPWDTGSCLLRTVSNHLYPYTPGSSKQAAWFDITFAPPGMGKSFFLSALNTALITSPENLVLPRISIIDIGYSSSAFVSLIKSALPKELKHLAQSYKLQMTKEYCINILDTPLGCQFPVSLDREFAINFLTDLLTPAGSAPISRLPEISSKLIDEMYSYYSEERYPKPYEKGTLDEVDNALDDLGIHIEEDEEVSWYKISTLLYDNNLYQMAVMAQRYAVPNISDATTVLNSSADIKNIYSDASVGQENTLKLIESMLSSVTSDYPIISSPSKFDIGEARICSIDLQDVAKGNSPQAKKRTGLMYMLARQVTCRTFYLDKDVLEEIPDYFKSYHQKIIDTDENVSKRICMDEYHRTRFSPGVRLQTLQDVREGRKFNIQISLLSQMVDDFDDDMIELANNIYIMSKGNTEETIKKIKDKFNPSDDAIKQLKRYCTGPGREGSSMLYIGELKDSGSIEIIVRLTLGPLERWAYSTTKEDVNLRERLTSEIGLNNALRILASEFPGGSAKDFLKSKGMDAENEDENIYEDVKRDLIIKNKDKIDTLDS
ncbi:ATP-binding protein [Psychromonas sp. SP041]|uniref:ATP-binding protein n=1 Tax=Psychromonas sp. SP041 TaxID=1365007 RepID=UPI0010C77177|nr:ATP-binding protein [Psychromonas sp. SP041]